MSSISPRRLPSLQAAADFASPALGLVGQMFAVPSRLLDAR
jgi:hypothetical protein